MMKILPLIFGVAVFLAATGSAQQPSTGATVQNLQSAYQKEAAAASFYRQCARRAVNEGYPELAKLFRAAVFSEEIHRENHLQALRQLGAPVPRMKPSEQVVESTRENLSTSAAAEREECRVMYPDYYRQARWEGVPAAMRTFAFARDAERAHAQLFQRAYNRFGRRPLPDTYFVCQTCGMTTAESVPAVCPVCRGSGLNYARVN